MIERETRRNDANGYEALPPDVSIQRTLSVFPVLSPLAKDVCVGRLPGNFARVIYIVIDIDYRVYISTRVPCLLYTSRCV